MARSQSPENPLVSSSGTMYGGCKKCETRPPVSSRKSAKVTTSNGSPHSSGARGDSRGTNPETPSLKTTKTMASKRCVLFSRQSNRPAGLTKDKDRMIGSRRNAPYGTINNNNNPSHVSDSEETTWAANLAHGVDNHYAKTDTNNPVPLKTVAFTQIHITLSLPCRARFLQIQH